jgi:tubulin-specific chaperone E
VYYRSGNRFRQIRDEGEFDGIKELGLEDTLLSWEDMCDIASRFKALTTFNVGTNQLSRLSSVAFGTLSSALTLVNLEFNDFTALGDLTPLTSLTSLRNLHLKGNNISSITSGETDNSFVFPKCLEYLDLSYNKVATWLFVDSLPDIFPGLLALRLTHNPIYESPDPDSTGQGKGTTEEAYMITIGRLATIKSLNFTAITESDRANAEMFYLSRIAKSLAAVPESSEASVIATHKRYAELCELYGQPDIIRRHQINPAFLEARLVTVDFHFINPESTERKNENIKRTSKIPKSFDIYAVKGIAAKLFGVSALRLKLIWETGEWDPVAGFEEEVGDSSEEEDAEQELEKVVSSTDALGGHYQLERKTGRWVKREVELKEGPRQLGFCVDGLEAKIRVELR